MKKLVNVSNLKIKNEILFAVPKKTFAGVLHNWKTFIALPGSSHLGPELDLRPGTRNSQFLGKSYSKTTRRF